jgi:hypothetical protein
MILFVSGGYKMKMVSTFEQNPSRIRFGSHEEPKRMTVEQQIEHWKRVGEANAKKYGAKR